MYNVRVRGRNEDSSGDWETPEIAKIREKRTKRLSPYSESQIWDRDELVTIIKYESHKRNKAILALMWDFNARNHEVTLLRINNVRFLKDYAEGEVPGEAKTGSGPILLRLSFPYVRDWLNEHPVKNNLNARLICNMYTGAPIRPETIWTMMKQLRKRIERLLETGEISEPQERARLEFLLKTKKWNPYCLRHSSITADSDTISEFALRKKVRWSMNSHQPARYIKNKMGDNLKRQLLTADGIAPSEKLAQKPAYLKCARCEYISTIETQVCKCGYPLSQSAFQEIKDNEKKEREELKQTSRTVNSVLQVLLDVLPNLDQEAKNRVAKDLIERRVFVPESS
jgi:hypothetical protein